MKNVFFSVHVQVPDGATVKALSRKTHPPVSPQGSLKGKTLEARLNIKYLKSNFEQGDVHAGESLICSYFLNCSFGIRGDMINLANQQAEAVSVDCSLSLESSFSVGLTKKRKN